MDFLKFAIVILKSLLDDRQIKLPDLNQYVVFPVVSSRFAL